MNFKNFLIGIVYLSIFTISNTAEIVKELSFTRYTLPDTYRYNKTQRKFQWEKISKQLDALQEFENNSSRLGTLRNYKNINGFPPIPKDAIIKRIVDTNHIFITDKYGISRNQAIPLYSSDVFLRPERYALDGTLVSIISATSEYVKIKVKTIEGDWFIPNRYIRPLGVKNFDRVAVVDRKNQNIATLEKNESTWKVKSMNPVSTGAEALPYQFPTPLGYFVVQNKLLKMNYLVDGSKTELAGYSPYATRFSGGGYLHGVPVNLPETEHIEYIGSLGTIPRSHMCVRNATSHAKFMYDWLKIGESIVLVIE